MEMAKPIASASLYGPLVGPICNPPVLHLTTRRNAAQPSAELAKAHAESEFEKYRIVQDRLFESDFDRMMKELPSEGDKP